MSIANGFSRPLRTSVITRSAKRPKPQICARSFSDTPGFPHRAYKFHTGVSWRGKPADMRRDLPKATWPANSPIGLWRNEVLKWPKGVASKDAGEDFFYVQAMKNGSGLSIGIADGVGGWVDAGVDPSLFSQALMYHAHRYSRGAWAGEPEIDPLTDYAEREEVEGWELTPMECMDLAYHGVLRERHVQAGSSTACIINMNASSGLLRSANLGDSGYMVIRASQIFYKQSIQTHFFNCPKQLTKMPHRDKKIEKGFADAPHEAELHEMKLRDGDLIVAFTDGLSDNVFPTEIAAIATLVGRKGAPEDERVQDMADRMVEYAKQCMYDKRRASPFEKEALREGLYYRGGKMDDVTAIVVLVRETA